MTGTDRPARPAAAGDDSPRVVFIAGVGRSGSTLLDRLLGSVPGICAVGELRYIWELGFVEDQFCACGQRFSACPFWAAVVTEAFGAAQFVEAAVLHERQEEMLRLRNLPSLVSGRPSAALREFRRNQLALYRAIAKVAGARFVVDSSKYPAYGAAVRGIDALDVRTLHLVRDSRGAVYSIIRPAPDPGVEGRSRPYRYPRGAVPAALGWLSMNALAATLRGRGYRRLRYEDLAAQPDRALDGVLRAIDCMAEPPGTLAEGRFDPEVQHTLAGNPSRLSTGPVMIRADEAWRDAMSRSDVLLTTALTWPLLLAWRYPLGRGRA